MSNANIISKLEEKLHFMNHRSRVGPNMKLGAAGCFCQQIVDSHHKIKAIYQQSCPFVILSNAEI